MPGDNPRSGSLEVDANVTTYILGRIALCNGDVASARRQFEANLTLWRATGDARCRPAVGALVGLSRVAVIQQKPDLHFLRSTDWTSLIQMLASLTWSMPETIWSPFSVTAWNV